jgi:hypothetical protein
MALQGKADLNPVWKQFWPASAHRSIFSSLEEIPMKTFALAAALATLALAGCASGTFVSKEQSAQFQVGTTTEQQVLAQLGQPDVKAELINGGHRDSYVRVVEGETPIDYVPLVALAVAPGFGHTATVNFDFDANGVLKDVSRFRERS